MKISTILFLAAVTTNSNKKYLANVQENLSRFLCPLAVCSCYGRELDEMKNDLLGIIGGQNTPIMNHPFQVSISVDNQFVCSGSLIHPNWVLTVASCIKGFDPYYTRVRAGSPKTNTSGTIYGVKKIITHKDFTDHNMDNDIALIQLENAVKQGPKIRLIRIANDAVTVQQPVTVTGWGVNSENTEGILMKVGMKIKELESCKEELTNEVITPRMICANSQNNNGPCWGDFGDPMVNQWHALVGMYSFTKECSRYPSIFTDVVSFKPWIKDHLSQAGHDLE